MSDDEVLDRVGAEFSKSNEDVARSVGDDKRRLERELRSAVPLLINALRPLFKGARFSFRLKRLTSVCGKHVLQWQLRAQPDMPESYHNQQTRRGIIRYVEME
jgi:hypothetical protein